MEREAGLEWSDGGGGVEGLADGWIESWRMDGWMGREGVRMG